MSEPKVVFKYPLAGQVTQVEVPFGGVIRTVRAQGEMPTLWIEHSPVSDGPFATPVDFVTRTFRAVATGETFDATDTEFVGTAFIGGYVWHIYEQVSA